MDADKKRKLKEAGWVVGNVCKLFGHDYSLPYIVADDTRGYLVPRYWECACRRCYKKKVVVAPKQWQQSWVPPR